MYVSTSYSGDRKMQLLSRDVLEQHCFDAGKLMQIIGINPYS
jgi:hypothetical protein